MAFLDESTWRGKVFSGGWKAAAGGEAPVIEPATGAELGRTGIASPADVAAGRPQWSASDGRKYPEHRALTVADTARHPGIKSRRRFVPFVHRPQVTQRPCGCSQGIT